MITELIPALVVFSIDLLIILGIIWFYENIAKIKIRDREKAKNLRANFSIGIVSGLVVYILSFVAGKLNFMQINWTNSWTDIAVKIFSSISALFLQLGIATLLCFWVIYWFFKKQMSE